ELKLIDHLKHQQTEPPAGRGGAAPAPPAEPIARLQLGPRQVLDDLELSGDGRVVWMTVDERPDGTARGQDVPNYVTTSAYPEMIPGRTNVGDVQPRRLLGAIDLASGKTVWADASAFAGVERKSSSSAADVPRVLDWTLPDQSDDRSRAVVSIVSQD